MMLTKQEPCRTVRRTDQQRTSPWVVGQTEIEKYATGCDNLSLSTTTSGYKKSLMIVPNGHDWKETQALKETYWRWLIYEKRPHCNNKSTTLHNDTKLATEIKAINNLGFDILPIQKSWHISNGLLTFEGDSIRDGNLSGQRISVNIIIV